LPNATQSTKVTLPML